MDGKIPLGARVRDRITGFSGVVVARTEWLFGCTRYGVAPEGLGEHGKIREAEWFDGSQLAVVDMDALALPDRMAADDRAQDPSEGPGGMPGCRVEAG